jgi:signal transduction histidine kinase
MTARSLRMPPVWRGLSSRLLWLTILVVMLSEVFIYAPSVARYRLVYLQERIASSHLATLALEASPAHKLTPALEGEVLDHAGVSGITLYKPGQAGHLMLSRDMPPMVNQTFDLRQGSFFGLIADAFAALARSGPYIIQVIGPSPRDSRVLVEVVLDETAMRAGMVDYSERILVLSVGIALATAAVVFLSLHLMIVRPMRRLTESMMAFGRDPEAAVPIEPGRRTDEVGVAQHVLAEMETGLRESLRERARLATLGAAVTRINHDLRNILQTAQLISDRLAAVNDPAVRKMAPGLMAAIDRAIALCGRTVDYAQSDQAMRRVRVSLRELVAEAGFAVGEPRGVAVTFQGEGEAAVEADRNQLFRVFANLIGNAAEAGAKTVRIEAARTADMTVVTVSDDGPGMPDAVKDTLFTPFARSSRPGGSGLGLAIVREVVRAHGGDIVLAASSAKGTSFRLRLPFG